MEEYCKKGKVLHATRSKTIRELVVKTNKLQIPREDIVAVLPEGGSFVLLYYYKGIDEQNGIQ